jgi:L-ascorbate metabolism protein UlaG (beta-lactamase superfamily)
VWFGHSSYLIKIGKVHVLVDPVFSGNAAPFRMFAKAFPGTDSYDADKLPDTIDVLLLTHDHYDHLDYKTILKLKSRVKHFYTSLGVGSHLEAWGIEEARITELDWWEETAIGEWGRLTATPARHFSGRSTKRNKTLWSSFVLKTEGHSFFLGGDSGYGEHFKEIGDRFGPFDIGFVECGQYGKYWPHIHMFPEQVVQAAQELKVKKLLPVHWAKFSLALHPWNEPIKLMTAAAVKAGQHFTTPLIGQPVVLNHHYPSSDWWDFE